jgi:hypothetical protein
MKGEKNLKFIKGKWYVDFTFKGKRIRHFGGYTKDQARNTLAKLRIEKLDERLGFKRPGSSEDVPFETFAEDFLETYSKPNKRFWKSATKAIQKMALAENVRARTLILALTYGL